MIELFRYIEQAFVVPSNRLNSIDVSSDSDFQNTLRREIRDGADQSSLRRHAEVFLRDRLVTEDGSEFMRSAQYLELRDKLLALRLPTQDEIQELIKDVFGVDAEDLVGSDAFLAEKTLLNDAAIAIKLTTGFDKVNAAEIVSMRQAIAFVEDLVEDYFKDLSETEIRNSLARPLKIPQIFLPGARPAKPAAEPTPPRPDPAVTRREELRKQQAALQMAYETLMALHPSQLKIRTPTPSDASIPHTGTLTAIDNGGNGEVSATAALSVLAIPPRILETLDPHVRSTIERELPDLSAASVQNVVEVVKRNWLDVSREVEPYSLPSAAKTYRLGIHLFAIQDLPAMANILPATPAVPDFSHAITRPIGIGNLQVVRQELVGYEQAEISHIENILPGELMRRVTQREETSELTITEETETTQTEERDLQSTQRNELAVEAQKEASQQTVATEGQTTTTNYGKLVENSKTNYARSVSDRAVNRVSQMVKQQRIQREKKVFSDTARHEFDNRESTERIRGIYQWVNKKYKTRILNYGKRLLYDVVVPEPAAFLIDSLKKAAQPENFQLARPPEPRIFPSKLNASNYMYWAALYGVTGSVTPPPEDFVETVAQTDAQNVDKKIQAYGQSFDGQVYQGLKIQIPENYKAIAGYVQHPGWSFFGSPGRLEFCIGEYYRIQFDPNSPYRTSFAMKGESGTLPVTLRSQAKMLQFCYAIGIYCQRMDKALEQWQLKTHAAIMSGYQRQRAEYLDQLSRYQAAVRTQMALAHNFARDTSVERMELKRLFIHLLVSEHLTTVGFPTPIHDQFFFTTDPNYVKKWGSVVAFFERAFEWENMMYVYYPYFYGRLARWGELILIQDLDPQFEAFLKAGAARVVVPVRPGFEMALAHYHETGDVWMGEEMPDMFSDHYVSIIAEIKARNFAPDEEICMAEWEVMLPTTLVMLKDDDKLPEWKPAKDCNPPAN